MDPQAQFCPNEGCRDAGRRGGGNIRVHRRQERCHRCATCGKTFAATCGTPYFRLRSGAELVTVVALLCHGCPLQAIVAAFGLDERTVACWWERAGGHCAGLHVHLVQTGRVDLGHVQADEIWVKLAGGRAWQAMAMAAPSRLWLGGVISPRRDLALIRALVARARACGRSLAVLVSADGLARPAGLLLAQVVTHTRNRRLTDVTRRVVIGSMGAVERADHHGQAGRRRRGTTLRGALRRSRSGRCPYHGVAARRP